MTDTPDEAPVRVALHYTGSNPITVPASANPVPYIIDPDSVVVVDEWAAGNLLERDDFVIAAGESVTDALRDAGLPTGGNAAAKRARLAENDAALLAVQTPDPNQAPEG